MTDFTTLYVYLIKHLDSENQSEPLYRRLSLALSDALKSNILPASTHLPSERKVSGINPIRLDKARLTNSEGRLAGAHIAMDECLSRMCDATGISVGSAVRMATANPAAALGLDDQFGTVVANKRASLTLLDKDLRTTAVIVDGKKMQPHM